MDLFVFNKITGYMMRIGASTHSRFCSAAKFVFYHAVVKENGRYENEFYIITSDRQIQK